MIKVLVADDEMRVCQLIKTLVEWEALGMELVGEAFNGVEALELLTKLNPDILITDIRMPGYNGLELIERAKEVKEDLGIVVISGHAHFEYAQAAMKFGVEDYLLKPINKIELNATLEKLGKKITSRLEQRKNEEKLIKRSQNDISKLRRRFIFDVLLSNSYNTELNEDVINHEYYYNFKAGLYRAFVLKFDFDYNLLNKVALRILEERSTELLKNIFDGCCNDIEMCFEYYSGYGICNYSEMDSETFKSKLGEWINALQTQMSLYNSVSFSVASAVSTNSLTSLSVSLRESVDMLYERLVVGNGYLIEKIHKHTCNDNDAIIKEFSKLLGVAIELLDLNDGFKGLDSMKSRVLSSNDMSGKDIYTVVIGVGDFILSFLPSEISKIVADDFILECSLCNNVEGLFNCLRTLLMAAVNQLTARINAEQTRPLRNAKKYIMEHFDEPLTLEEVSSFVGFNPSYFSVIFKKECGCGFLEYLSEVRMNRAKELLRDTGMSVAEICTFVGYNDIKHFTKLFIKHTKLKPSEFRKLYG